MEDPQLFARLQAEPNANRSTLEIEHDRTKRERQRTLTGIRKPVTQVEREEQARRFRAIQAQAELENQLEQDSLIAQREREIQQLVTAALEVATEEERAAVLERARPKLRQFALYSTDVKVADWCWAQIQQIRADKSVI